MGSSTAQVTGAQELKRPNAPRGAFRRRLQTLPGALMSLGPAVRASIHAVLLSTAPPAGSGASLPEVVLNSANPPQTLFAVVSEPEPSDLLPFARHTREVTMRRLDQLGVHPTGSWSVTLVLEDGAAHAQMVVRAILGKNGLARGAVVHFPAPEENNNSTSQESAGTEAKEAVVEAAPVAASTTTIAELAENFAGGTIAAVEQRLRQVLALDAVAVANPGKKVFANLSVVTTFDDVANAFVAMLLTLDPQDPARRSMIQVLGAEPTLVDRHGSPSLADVDLNRVKKALVYPALRQALEDPALKGRLDNARRRLTQALLEGRKHGLLVFVAAGNSYLSAAAAGDPSASRDLVMEGVKGAFVVGAADTTGSNPKDHAIAPFSSDGPITAVASGVDVGWALRNGKLKPISGTSFSTPIMLSTAYLVNEIDPKLSVDQLEQLLTDPRVTRDLGSTSRGGAGLVDPLAAILVAQNPQLEERRIEQILSTLDAHPDRSFPLTQVTAAQP